MSIFQSRRQSALIAGGALLLSVVALVPGCGGGGSGTSIPTSTPSANPTATSSATPAATSISSSCTASTFTPNYYGLRDPSAVDDSPGVYNFWRKFPVTVYIPSSANSAFRTSTINGFNQWVTATGGKASYTLVSSASGANLVVSYSAQDPNSDTLGVTTVNYNGSQHYITSASMDLALYTPSTSNANAINQSIAAHEFGHALGIGPHSPFSNDLMYPYLESDVEPVTTRDLNTLKTIYCNNFPTTSVQSLKNEGPIKTLVIRN